VEALPNIDAGLLERALAMSRDGFLLSDVRLPGRPVVYANASFEALTGYPYGDVLGRSCAFLQGEGSDPAAIEEMGRTMREGGSCEVTLLNYRKDGTPFWNEVKLSPVRAEDGALTHYVGTQHDVTTRVEAETARRAEEERYRSVVGALDEGIVLMGADGTLRASNASAGRILGADAQELAARGPFHDGWEGVWEDGTPARPEAMPIVESLRSGTPRTGVVLGVRRPDGARRWLSVNTRALYRDGEDGPYAAVASFSDVTEKKRADDELRFQAQLMDEVEAALIALDGDTRITHWNSGAERLYGWSREEVLGRRLRELIVSPEELSRAVSAGRSARAGNAVEQEFMFRRKDGTLFPGFARTVPIPSTNGGPPGLITMVLDVSERLRADSQKEELETRLRQAERLESVGRLAGGIAHDFNNLLAVILNYAGFAAQHLEAGSAVRADVEEIGRAAERAAALTRQLLTFSRRGQIEPEVLRLSDVAMGMENLLGRTLGSHVDLVMRIAPGAAPVEADRGQVEQILMNLAVNARDAMPDGGTLTVTVENVDMPGPDGEPSTVDGRLVRLAVADSGHGMEEGVRQRAFEPFYTTKAEGEGNGFGLATVYDIAKQAGGHVEIASAPGRGTVVAVHFPATTRPVAVVDAPPDTPEDAGQGGETILLVEDVDAIRRLTMRILTRHGYTVLEAAHPEEALRLFDAYTGVIDLVLTDMVMPGMSGRALAERLADREPRIGQIFMSGYPDDSVVSSGGSEHGPVFLQKPFTQQALLQGVRRAMPERVEARAAGAA